MANFKKILVVTTTRDIGVDFIIKKLRSIDGIKVFRFNIDDYPSKITINTRLSEDGEVESVIHFPYQDTLKTSEIYSAFYRREAEAIINQRFENKEDKLFAKVEIIGHLDTLWDTINCFWVNHPRYSTHLMTKVAQTHYAGSVGFRVPKTIISTDPKELRKFYQKCKGKVVVKQLGNARGAQDWIEGRMYTVKVTREHLKLLDKLACVPVMMQEQVEKKSELRITVVGNDVFAVEIDSQSNSETKIDWRHGHIGKLPHKIYALPLEIKKKLISLHKELNLLYSGTDMIITPRGEYVLLELNANGEYVWTEILTKLPIT